MRKQVPRRGNGRKRVPVPVLSLLLGRRARNTAAGIALYVLAGCGGGGGGGGPTAPPTPTTISATLRFEDYVAGGRKANALDFQVRSPTGATKKVDANQVTFEQDQSGSYCIVDGGSHVKSFGADKCYTVSQSGSQTYKVLENASDVQHFWDIGDAARFTGTRQLRALYEQSVFKASDFTQGNQLAADCTNSPQFVLEPGTIGFDYANSPPNYTPPTGFDFVIVKGLSPVTAGAVMGMNKSPSELDVGGEFERPRGIAGEYGGLEELKPCAYAVKYATSALNAGAPK